MLFNIVQDIDIIYTSYGNKNKKDINAIVITNLFTRFASVENRVPTHDRGC